jgi:hypothetical protein
MCCVLIGCIWSTCRSGAWTPTSAAANVGAYGLRLPAVARHRGTHPVPDLRRPLALVAPRPPRLRYLRPGRQPPSRWPVVEKPGRNSRHRTSACRTGAARCRRPSGGRATTRRRRPEGARRRSRRLRAPCGTECSRTVVADAVWSRVTRGAKSRRSLGPGRRGRGTRKLSRSSPPLAAGRPHPASTGRPGHCTGSGVPAGHTPLSFTYATMTGRSQVNAVARRRAAHAPRPVPVHAAVVAGQAPGRGLPLLGAVAPGPRPDAAQATHPRSAAPHRPGHVAQLLLTRVAPGTV